MDDAELLERYVSEADEAAFAEIVHRFLPMVFSAALRQVRRPELAEDVAQVVFVLLSRKAARLPRDVVLSGWLYQATRYSSQRAMRTEMRRIKRERDVAQEGAQMEQSEPSWNSMEPVLDDLLASLRERDRLVLVLRFFEGLSLAQIGERLGTTEDAAQKRVSRALERLRHLFERRSVPVSTAALATLLSTQAVASVPASVAAGVALSASSGGVSMAPFAVTLLESTTKMMTWIKIKSIAPIGAAAALAAGVPIVGLHQQNTALEKENQALQVAVEEAKELESQAGELKALQEQVEELKGLREQASEVHKLRAQVTQLSRERTDLLGRINALEKARSASVSKPAPVFEVLDESSESPGATERIAAMNSMKKFALALLMYAGENEGRFPAGAEELDQNVIGDALEVISLEELVMIDYGTVDAIDDPQNSIVFASRDPIGVSDDGRPVWVYAFGDGHSEVSPFEVGDDGKYIR